MVATLVMASSSTESILVMLSVVTAQVRLKVGRDAVLIFNRMVVNF